MGKVKHLNAMESTLIDEARKLGSRLLVRDFLAYHVDPASHRYLKPFIEDVVEGTIEAAEWRRGRVIVPDWSLADQLTTPRETLLAPVGTDFRYRVKPRVRDWKHCASWIGAPARPISANLFYICFHNENS
jgi:hypothetical protein